MLSFTGSLKVFLAVKPADLRKSFNGLYALTSNGLLTGSDLCKALRVNVLHRFMIDIMS